MSIELIDLQEKDYTIVKEIYDWYVINTTVTFGTEPISIQELKETIFTIHPKYRSYLIKKDKELTGFCYFSPHRKRKAYDRTAEISVYLKPEFAGKGIGREVLEKLKSIARDNGISVLIGIITAENYQSIALFEKCGFEKCAHFKKVGEKFNRLLDVVAMQKILDE